MLEGFLRLGVSIVNFEFHLVRSSELEIMSFLLAEVAIDGSLE